MNGDHRAVAKAAAARIVAAGRSAAVAVRGRSGGSARSGPWNSSCATILSTDDGDRSAATVAKLFKANQAVAAAALRARETESQLELPRPRPDEFRQDISEVCEWDVTVQRTFITVIPVCKRLISTVSAPPRLDHARRRRHTRRRPRNRGKRAASYRKNLANLACAAP